MSTVTLELDTCTVEKLAEKLPMKDKIRLVQTLEKETQKARWNNLLNSIDTQLKKLPISEEVISKEIKCYRKEKYAKKRN